MEKNLVGEVLKRFCDERFKVVGAKMIQLTDDLLSDHYSHLVHLPFFPEIVDFMKSSPVVVMILQGDKIIDRVRELLGPTDSRIAEKGTIRGDFGTDKMRNILHASDSLESAQKEIDRFFKPEERFY